MARVIERTDDQFDVERAPGEREQLHQRLRHAVALEELLAAVAPCEAADRQEEEVRAGALKRAGGERSIVRQRAEFCGARERKN